MAVPQIRFERSTSYEDALGRAAAECGVDREYYDIFGKRHAASFDALGQILSALGWNVESAESIDRGRAREFSETNTLAIPKTLVLSDAAKFIPLTLDDGSTGSVGFELTLETGERLSGSLETSQMPVWREVQQDGSRFRSYQLSLPIETPFGYHTLRAFLNDQEIGSANIIICPDRAHLPERLAGGGRMAGFNVALYGLRSSRNWGCGDFTDLRALADWAKHAVGFNFIGLNPLHALHNRVPYNTSPYLPLSIYYKNLIYIDIERVPEFAHSRYAQAVTQSRRTQTQLQALREAESVAYHEVHRLKTRFLKLLYREFRRLKHEQTERTEAFSAYCGREGDLLHKFALYCALDEILHKQDRNRWTWRDWPLEYQSPDSDAAKQFAEQHPRTVEFYKFVQFVIDEQLGEAQQHAKEIGMEVGLYHDLAVATDSCGSDLWAHGGHYVNGCRVGAPPDDFSPKGQDWGFPPPNARAHCESGYYLFRESIRKILKFGGALRIDHVMRLFRLFWIPSGMEAAQGTYVRDFATDLMRILALESVRCQTIIIGEDLGTVTDEIRAMLADFRILSYRLFYFEKRQADGSFKDSWEYPRQALVSSTTHDLPTLAGFWLNRDIEARKAAGLADEQGYLSQLNDRKREKQRMLDTLHFENLVPQNYERNAEKVTELDGDLHNAVVGFLMQVPSMLLLVNQEDLTKETEQQNLPGSTAEYPNWQRKMLWSIEDLHSRKTAGFIDMFRHQLARTGRV